MYTLNHDDDTLCHRRVLESVYDEVRLVDVLESGDTAHLALMKRPDLGVTFTKLHCWTLTHYSKCVFMDADTLVGPPPPAPPTPCLASNAGPTVQMDLCIGRHFMTNDINFVYLNVKVSHIVILKKKNVSVTKV